jgi:hypothetical protein
MTIRSTVTKIIEGNPGASSDEKARLIIGALYGIGVIEPGNGWLDDDEEMLEDLDRAWGASR